MNTARFLVSDVFDGLATLDDGGLRVDLEYVLDALLVVQENQK